MWSWRQSNLLIDGISCVVSVVFLMFNFVSTASGSTQLPNWKLSFNAFDLGQSAHLPVSFAFRNLIRTEKQN